MRVLESFELDDSEDRESKLQEAQQNDGESDHTLRKDHICLQKCEVDVACNPYEDEEDEEPCRSTVLQLVALRADKKAHELDQFQYHKH